MPSDSPVHTGPNLQVWQEGGDAIA